MTVSGEFSGIGQKQLTALQVRRTLPLVMTNAVNVWAVLGDATRRAIFEQLAERPCPVGELAANLPVTRPAVSQHLKVLKEAGLVVERVNGTRHIYQVDPAGVKAVRAELDRFWRKTLAAYKSVVEESEREE